jgi:LacI family transcriptional regulator
MKRLHGWQPKPLLKEKKSPKTKLTIEYPETIAEAKRVTLNVLKDKHPPDAIFCMGDQILIGAMYAVHKLKLRVPEDISIITISNGLMPTMYDPKITYVETSGYKLGKLAFAQMLSCLKNQLTPEEVILESILVEGGSL